MPTPQELLEALETRLIMGEISEAVYHELKAKLEAKLGDGVVSSSSGGQNIGEGNVIRGDITNTTGAASVGNVVFNAPGASVPAQSGAEILICPLCGRRNEARQTFRCIKCQRDHLCLDHFDATARACEECVAKDESLRAEAEQRRQADEAEARRKAAARTPKTLELDCGNGAAMKFALIPSGEFVMGSGEYDNEKPQHRVAITRPFYMGVYPVTQAQYRAVTDNAPPSKFKGYSNPVECVSWHDAEEFCGALSARSGRSVRLPTEAEWEYACRAGTTTSFSFGDDEVMLGRYGWFDGNSGDKTHPVGQKQPNPWGLHDMHGNVWEWCSDLYADSYANAGETDPQGPGSGTARVLRGGGWDSSTRDCRSANRDKNKPDNRDDDVGFRVVVGLE